VKKANSEKSHQFVIWEKKLNVYYIKKQQTNDIMGLPSISEEREEKGEF
jgi:hypothetical protein